MNSDATRPPTSSILFGAAYYHEYHREDRLEQDLDLMARAHVNVIRVGESVWSTWEPDDGRFELEWLAPVLDAAHERGIGVVLGTPTYAIPPWLWAKHPHLAAEDPQGQATPWGSRQEVNYASPIFRSYAERVIRAIVSRYASHPAVVGYQVDNEPGLHLIANAEIVSAFKSHLHDKWKSVDAINEEWGLTYWSHRLRSFEELWGPVGNSSPQYDLAWREFQARTTSEFIAWQADIVREYALGHQFVTTCLQYGRPAVHDAHLSRELDITAGNPYYGTQERMRAGNDLPAVYDWTATGPWGLFQQADRMYSSRQQPFLVTETNAQSIGGPESHYPPYPGQIAQAALALVARGARMIEYWHWNTLPYGFETYWGGVLPHSQRPGRIYREVAALGERLSLLSDTLDGLHPHSDVTMVFSQRSRWAMAFMPPLQNGCGEPDPEAYQRIFDAHYRGLLEAHLQVRVLHDEQLATMSPGLLAADHPVLVVAGLYVADDELIETLRGYVREGGHLVLGVRSFYADSEARARTAIAPPGLADLAGVEYAEYTTLDAPLPVTESGADSTADTAPGGMAEHWLDILEVNSARIVKSAQHPGFGPTPVVTLARTSGGAVTTVATVPDPALSRELAELCPVRPRWRALFERLPDEISVHTGTNRDGDDVVFVHHWDDDSVALRLRAEVWDPICDTRLRPGELLTLGPWDVQVLVVRKGGGVPPS